MSEQQHTRRTWFVPYPSFLRHEPQRPRDLVADLSGADLLANDPREDDDILFATEAEAWAAARRYLTEARDQALKDIDLLSRPYYGGRGEEYVLHPDTLARLQAEAREELRIAQKGLTLCPPA